jgi:hypothetical protein
MKRNVLEMKVSPFTLMNGYLYKLGPNDILICLSLEHERETIIEEAHFGPIGGYFHVETTIRKILQVGVWWPKLHKDCRTKIKKCHKCQRMVQPL